MQVANKTGPQKLSYSEFLIACFNYYRIFAVHFIKYYRRWKTRLSIVAGIFMPVYDHSIWRFRTPV